MEVYSNNILIQEAYEHNLKHISLEIPKNRLVVITGPSGSGKSSLVFDTLFQESQRLFLESLSLYSKSYIRLQAPAKVKLLSHLCPSISIDQKTRILSRRSTVGTVSEISDVLRLLYARFGRFPTDKQEDDLVFSRAHIEPVLSSLPASETVWLGVPWVENRKGSFYEQFQKLLSEGFLYVWADGKLLALAPDLMLERHQRHTIFVLIDKLKPTRAPTAQKIEAILAQAKKLKAAEVVCLSSSTQTRFRLPLSDTQTQSWTPRLEPHHFSFNNPFGQCKTCEGLGEDDQGVVCPTCDGSRIHERYGSVCYQNLSFKQASLFTLGELHDYVQHQIKIDSRHHPLESQMILGFRGKLGTLCELGLGYLPLSRSASTLSGGETQRLRIGSLINLEASGYLYIFDEPSIGLHPLNTDQLIHQLRQLAQQNTVVVVEHDLETIQAADYLIELGPGGGQHGGDIVFSGTSSEFSSLKNSAQSSLHSYLQKTEPLDSFSLSLVRSSQEGIVLKNVRFRNLKIDEIQLPLNRLVGIAGVSGSGKSSLLFDTFIPQAKALGRSVYEVTQEPVGKSSRSTVATYLEVYNSIRHIFSASLSARMRGLTQREFSFNASQFRCETCKGLGYERFELSFLPQSEMVCERCQGTRFQEFVLRVRYKDKSISDVLEMTLEEASLFFHDFGAIAKPLQLCLELGLGYIKLGQLTSTLSGGEAQRLKLIFELSKRKAQNNIYCLDEPTTGLSICDIQFLLKLFSRLLEQRNSIFVIEHHPGIIAQAQYIIELGPGGGPQGGKVIAIGSPQQIRKHKASKIGKFI